MIGDRSALRAAGIEDAQLRRAYLTSRKLLVTYAGSYWVASLFAPAYQRAHLWAVYGFARHTDQIVDTGDPAGRAEQFDAWHDRVEKALATGSSEDAVLRSLMYTISVWRIPADEVIAQLRGHRRDLTTSAYGSYEELNAYIDDVAGGLARMILPILKPYDLAAARPLMVAAFAAAQVTDFLQDLAADLGQGRLYLPQEDLDRHGVVRADLEGRRLTDEARSLLRFEVDRTRGLVTAAMGLLPLLPKASRPLMMAGFELTSGVLDDIERRGFDVFSGQPGMSTPAKLAVVARTVRRRVALVGQHKSNNGGHGTAAGRE